MTDTTFADGSTAPAVTLDPEKVEEARRGFAALPPAAFAALTDGPSVAGLLPDEREGLRLAISDRIAAKRDGTLPADPEPSFGDDETPIDDAPPAPAAPAAEPAAEPVAEAEPVESRVLVIPLTGEVIERSDTARIITAIDELKQARAQLGDLIGALEEAVLDAARREGTQTLHVASTANDRVQLVAEVTGVQGDLVWDLDELAKLLDAGLPEARYAELVKQTVSYKVDARVAGQIEKAGNEDYARIIDGARSRRPSTTRVSVKVAK